jgi:predicted ABC-type transport system involved in lysophospholipase L1 biosynthesis ATPase subunit
VVLQIDGVTKNYGGLRPLRIKQLTIGDAERVALVGFDQPAAEMFVNLVTGQSLPDAGTIDVFGRRTATITDSSEWLAMVDRFGIVSGRAVLLESLTAVQNLAMPFTLSIEPVSDDVRSQAEGLGRALGLDTAALAAPVSSLTPVGKMRLRVARALALNPAVLLLEHVSAELSARDAAALARDIASVAGERRIALAALTVDEPFARIVAQRVLHWEPASGRLAERRGWFGGRVG